MQISQEKKSDTNKIKDPRYFFTWTKSKNRHRSLETIIFIHRYRHRGLVIYAGQTLPTSCIYKAQKDQSKSQSLNSNFSFQIWPLIYDNIILHFRSRILEVRGLPLRPPLQRLWPQKKPTSPASAPQIISPRGNDEVSSSLHCALKFEKGQVSEYWAAEQRNFFQKRL